MSSLASWSYVEGPLTVWPVNGTDEWGAPNYGTVYKIDNVDYQEGGDISRDDDGTEFTPNQIIWFEASFASGLVPEREWYVKLGDHTGLSEPPNDAERVRSIKSWAMTKFGANQLPDHELMT